MFSSTPRRPERFPGTPFGKGLSTGRNTPAAHSFQVSRESQQPQEFQEFQEPTAEFPEVLLSSESHSVTLLGQLPSVLNTTSAERSGIKKSLVLPKQGYCDLA